MRLESLLLADAAQVREGLLFVMGGGIDTFSPQPLPPGAQGIPGQVTLPVSFAVAMRLSFNSAELSRQHQFEMIIADEDGQRALQGNIAVFIQRNPTLPQGWDQPSQLAFNVQLAPKRLGLYRLDILSNGQVLAGLPFRIHMAVQVPPRPPQT